MRKSLVALMVSLALAGCATNGSSRVDNDSDEVAVLQTSHGVLVFQFFADEAPHTTAQIKNLIREGFYDGRVFYRVVAGHVIQTGDEEGAPANGYPTVVGEFDAHEHVTGAVGLARSDDPDSGSTEIYICHAPRPHLDGRYAVFGILTEGYDVLDRIGNVPVDEAWVGDEQNIAFHRPKEPVTIERAFIEVRNR